MEETKFVQANIEQLNQFIRDLKIGLLHFRYFNNRQTSAISQHLHTLLLLNEANYPVAYGHLEKENDELWLGMAVADKHVGRGLGKKMITALIDFANAKAEASISLTVDSDNFIAQNLYLSYGFKKIKEKGKIFFYKLELV
jgi:GNAT superfamily N-acetyltransferase